MNINNIIIIIIEVVVVGGTGSYFNRSDDSLVDRVCFASRHLKTQSVSQLLVNELMDCEYFKI